MTKFPGIGPKKVIEGQNVRMDRSCRWYIDDDSISVFQSIKSLKCLNISSTRIGDRGATCLFQLSGLTYLDICAQ